MKKSNRNPTVKLKVRDLMDQFGAKATAIHLDIELSWVYKLSYGSRPSKRLYRDIVKLHLDTFKEGA